MIIDTKILTTIDGLIGVISILNAKGTKENVKKLMDVARKAEAAETSLADSMAKVNALDAQEERVTELQRKSDETNASLEHKKAELVERELLMKTALTDMQTFQKTLSSREEAVIAQGRSVKEDRDKLDKAKSAFDRKMATREKKLATAEHALAKENEDLARRLSRLAAI